MPADGSFNLTKQVDRNEGLTPIALSSGADGLAEEVAALTDAVLGRPVGFEELQG